MSIDNANISGAAPEITRGARVLPRPPVKTLVPIESATLWRPDEARLTRKYDGEFEARELGGALFAGEWVRRKSGGCYTASDLARLAAWGEFYAVFDCLAVPGQWLGNRPLQVRQAALNDRAGAFDGQRVILAETVVDVAAALAAGAEGVCRNEWGAPYGAMLAVKRGGIWLCRVSRLGGTQAAEIERAEQTDGETFNIEHSTSNIQWKPAGRVKLGGGKIDRVRPGSLVRIEGMGLTDGGKIREPRPCREWLVKY